MANFLGFFFFCVLIYTNKYITTLTIRISPFHHPADKISLTREGMRRRLTIVAINDVYELTNFSRLKSLLKDVRETRSNPVLACLAGDFLAPSILSSMDKVSRNV